MNSPTAASTTKLRILIVGVLIPLILATTSLSVMYSWLPELPDPIAVHWSGAGADGFGAALPFILVPFFVTLIYAVFVFVATRKLSKNGRPSWNQKFITVVAVWLSSMLSISFLGSTFVQRGLQSATQAPDTWTYLLLGAGVGLALSTAGWFFLPRWENLPLESITPNSVVEIDPGERVTWMKMTRIGWAGISVMAFAVAVSLTALVLVTVAGRMIWVSVAVLCFIVILVLTNTWWWICADHRGLLVHGILGWPRTSIPLADIRSVQVVQVNATRDFGGWGWRWAGNGRSGVILKSGPALEVTRSSGKRFVITTGDAETAAGVLAGLLAESSSSNRTTH
ncbi:MAG: hypothetical protein IT191_05870 [Microbacteriaceae bacterium]|nr:hypothetical protein [Microbacteriaceae bacterium]